MVARGGIAPSRIRVSAGAAGRRGIAPSETAWLLLGLALPVALIAIALLGPPLGRAAFTGTHYTYWPSDAAIELFPKPTELARFVLTVACSLLFAMAIVPLARLRLRLPGGVVRRAIPGIQLLLAAALAFAWWKQRDVPGYGLADTVYFSPATLVAAGVLAAIAAAAIASPTLAGRLGAASGGAPVRLLCGAVAVLATVLWLLPSVFTDADIAFAPIVVPGHMTFAFDEAMSVLDGRSPLVNMATYGALVPYLVALPLAALGASLAAFTTLMVALTAAALLAVYATLRRLARTAWAALALYVPFLATSLFIVSGEAVERFDYGNYFGMFPIRYAGPYALLWLLTRQLDGDRPRSPVVLFAAAGLVALNNTDFGLPALGATLVALACAHAPRTRSAAVGLVVRVVAGLALAFALVSLLTLLREGTLPHLSRLFAFARLFGVAGFGNLPTPLLGFHLVILATFVAAAATAAVRVASREPDATLTAVLAWCGVFGLGTGAYFAYRSHPHTLVALFSIWALTLAVLLIAALRAESMRRPGLPALALLFCFGVCVCSVVQFPLPWLQVERIARATPGRPLEQLDIVNLVRAYSRPGDAVAIPTALGHRIAYESGVTNITAYTGMAQMPTVEQLRETLRALRAAGGRMLFLGEEFPREVPNALSRAGFRPVATVRPGEFIAWRDERARR